MEKIMTLNQRYAIHTYEEEEKREFLREIDEENEILIPSYIID